MRESAGMLARRRRESRSHAAPRLPDTIARLVTFSIVTRTETAAGIEDHPDPGPDHAPGPRGIPGP